MAIIARAKSSIRGLTDDLLAINQAAAAEVQARQAATGDLTALTTTAKESLVAAINEVLASVGEAGDGLLVATNNLSDVASATEALSNLGGIDAVALAAAIEEAKLALGTNHTVEDIAGRDALEDLDTLDRVFVKDDGDGKWANYQVGAVVEGVVTEWIKIADQDSLENSISAPAIKAAYESNADTNAFSDAEKAKVGLVTVTEAIDLDTVVKESDVVSDLAAAADAAVPNAGAVKAYFAAQPAGVAAASESLVVADGEITLTNAPIGGPAGVLNFGTVRYISGDGIAYDAPVVATAEPLVFAVSTDTANQWDGNTVQVQYLYSA